LAGIDILALATLVVTLSDAALPIAFADAVSTASAVFNAAVRAGFFVAAGFCAITGPQRTASPNAIDIKIFILDS
jgi:hypothetical protein